MLDRLGAPEEIVAAAAADAGLDTGGARWPVASAGGQPGPSGVGGLGGLEIAAIVTLVVGAVVVPVANVVVGLVLVWLSTVWTRAEKLTVTAVPVAVPLVAVLGFAAPAAGWSPEPTGADAGAGLELLPDRRDLAIWMGGEAQALVVPPGGGQVEVGPADAEQHQGLGLGFERDVGEVAVEAFGLGGVRSGAGCRRTASLAHSSVERSYLHGRPTIRLRLCGLSRPSGSPPTARSSYTPCPHPTLHR